MNKIMFNDKYGLTRAVLEGRKTMTRRLITNQEAIYTLDELEHYEQTAAHKPFVEKYSRYQIDEKVAVAQSYNDIYEELKSTYGSSSYVTRQFFHKYIQGGRMPVSNKMFVRAEACFHRIRINDINVERLQDISDEDCMREGIKRWAKGPDFYFFDGYGYYDTPNDAFAALIDKVSGRGTWDSNPWVFAYTFEVIKGKVGDRCAN